MVIRHFLLSLCIYCISAKHIHIQLRDNITQTCPSRHGDVIDRDSIKLSIEMVSGGYGGGDTVTVTDLSGQSKTINFPGCYRVSLQFKMNQPIKNPYIEAFLQLGTNIPCQNEGRSRISDICTNITQSNWCPQSTNSHLRKFLQGKHTCQFCHLCGTIEKEEDNEEVRKYFQNEGSEQCETTGKYQNLRFKMCTPTAVELRQKNEQNEGKLEEYWQFLKQGVLVAVVHILDRKEHPNNKISQCRTLCKTYKERKGVSDSYKATLLRSIENMCSPQDEYTACIYHTLKFDLNGAF